MSVNLSILGGAGWQFFDSNGIPLAGGLLYTYAAGTTTPLATYTTSAGNVANANPIVLDSAGRLANEVWLTTGSSYKFVLKSSSGTLLGTYDNISGINDLTALSVPTGSSLVGFIQAGSGAVATTAQEKMRQMVSVIDFGADPTGVEDSGAAFRAAIASLPTTGGGIYVPNGTYKVTAATDDTSNTAIYVPSGVRIYGASQIGAKIVPGANNVVCFRMIGLNGGIENLQINNTSYTNVSGIRLAPTDETQLITRSDTEFNEVTNVSIRNIQEGIVLKCGPTVSGQDSYCYYNTFTNIDIRNTVVGIWLKVPNSTLGSGCNRNTFISCRVAETGTNSGLIIDAGNTNKFFGLSFEGIQSGASPSSTPTAVTIAYNSASYGCTHNQFYGLIIEACTRSFANSNDLTECYGWVDETNTYNTPTFVGALPLAVDFTGSNLYTVAPIKGTELTLISQDGAPILLNPSSSATKKAIVSTTAGTSSNYNGTTIKNNYSSVQANITLPSWFLDIGGAEVGNGIGVSDTLGIHRMAAGGSTWTNLFLGDNAGAWKPGTDNTQSLGTAANRWSVVYAGNGTINTSDGREKQQVKPIDDAVLRAWAKVEYCAFKFNDAVALKGDGARWHIGLIAQKVKEAFESEGLDAFAYGLLCYDQWDEIVEDVMEEVDVTLEDGTVVKGAKPTGKKRVVLQAGDRYGLRYEQALALEAAYLRSLVKKLLAKSGEIT